MVISRFEPRDVVARRPLSRCAVLPERSSDTNLGDELGTVIGCWLNAGVLTGPQARYGTVVLGVLLVIYASSASAGSERIA